MTTYTLTGDADTFTGKSGTDVFEGVAGGKDTLSGGGGNDIFNIQDGQTGSISGGLGYDVLHLVGPSFNNELNAGLSIAGIEELIVDASNLYASVAQLKYITHFGVNNDNDLFAVFLQGGGGTLDFSTSFTEPQNLQIEAEMVTSAVAITGSATANFVIGSDFNDKLNGFSGADTLYGGAGNDVVDGGLGKDTLYGDDGKDSYLFDTALGASNVDHLGDFRPVDDSIRIDDAIFSWSGQTTGALNSAFFKVISGGGVEDNNDHILYNQTTGALYYDVDGNLSGGHAPVLFAIADNFSGSVPVITAADFVVV